MELRAPLERKEHEVRWVLKELKEHRVPQELKVQEGHKETLDSLAIQVPKAHRDQEDHKELKDLKGLKELQDHHPQDAIIMICVG